MSRQLTDGICGSFTLPHVKERSSYQTALRTDPQLSRACNQGQNGCDESRVGRASLSAFKPASFLLRVINQTLYGGVLNKAGQKESHGVDICTHQVSPPVESPSGTFQVTDLHLGQMLNQTRV